MKFFFIVFALDFWQSFQHIALANSLLSD